MNDYYTEQRIQQKPSNGLKYGLIALNIAMYVASYFMILLAVLALLLTVYNVVMYKRYDVEYEYIYVNGELDIDKIYSKEKRKHVFGTKVSDLEVLAPCGHAELQKYADVKGKDFTSREMDQKVYEMVVKGQGSYTKILFEPNQAVLEGFKRFAPRKVFE